MSNRSLEQEDLDFLFDDLYEAIAISELSRPIPQGLQKIFDGLDALVECSEASELSIAAALDADEIALNSTPEIALPATPEIALPSIPENEPQHKASLGFPTGCENPCAVVPSHTPPNTLNHLSLNPFSIHTVDHVELAYGDAGEDVGAGRGKPGKAKTKETEATKKFARAIDLAGRQSGLTFTLNLGVGVEGTLYHSADPARIISDRLNRALKDAGFAAPRYAFSIEISPDDRLYIHGAIIVDDPWLQRAPKSLLRRALAKAGGKIEGRAAARQVDLKPFTIVKGWRSYILWDHQKTADALGTDKLTFISAPLRREVNGSQFPVN